jgi:protease I
MSELNKKIVMLLAPKNFRDEEFFIPEKFFKEHGIQVTVASTNVGTVTGKLGGKALADSKLSDIKMTDYDCLLIVGGGGSQVYWNDATVKDLILEAVKFNKIISAICIAPVCLANAGILVGKNATVFIDGKDTLIRQGALYKEDDVVVDGNIITANGPHAAVKFARTILEELKS